MVHASFGRFPHLLATESGQVEKMIGRDCHLSAAAKQQRMLLLTPACVLGAAEKLLDLPAYSLFVMLILINLGTLLTCVRRTVRLVKLLEAT